MVSTIVAGGIYFQTQPRNSIENLLPVIMYVICFLFCSQKQGAYNVSKTTLLGYTKNWHQTSGWMVWCQEFSAKWWEPRTAPAPASLHARVPSPARSCPTGAWTLRPGPVDSLLRLLSTAFGINSRIRTLVLCEGPAQSVPHQPFHKDTGLCDVEPMWLHLYKQWWTFDFSFSYLRTQPSAS